MRNTVGSTATATMVDLSGLLSDSDSDIFDDDGIIDLGLKPFDKKLQRVVLVAKPARHSSHPVELPSPDDLVSGLAMLTKDDFALPVPPCAMKAPCDTAWAASVDTRALPHLSGESVLWPCNRTEGANELGPEHPRTLASSTDLASALFTQGMYAEAAAMFRETLVVPSQKPQHPGTLLFAQNLALVLDNKGKYDEVLLMFRESLAASRRVQGPEHPGTLLFVKVLALELDSQGRYAEAAAMFQETLLLEKRVLDPDHPTTLTFSKNLADALMVQGEHTEAAAMFRMTLLAEKRVLGPDHPDTLTSANNLATALHSQGKHADAAAIFRDTFAARTRVLGTAHPDTLKSANKLAQAVSMSTGDISFTGTTIHSQGNRQATWPPPVQFTNAAAAFTGDSHCDEPQSKRSRNEY